MKDDGIDRLAGELSPRATVWDRRTNRYRTSRRELEPTRYVSKTGPPFTVAEEQEIRAIFRRAEFKAAELSVLAAFQTRDSARYEALHRQDRLRSEPPVGS